MSYKMETFEERKVRYIEKIKNLTMMSDILARNVLKDKECCEYILRIIMNDSMLTVLDNQVQVDYKNLHGRSAVLDCVAKSGDGRLFNVEIQQEDEGAIPKRARYHLGLMDMNVLNPGEFFDKLPETYIIFVTQDDTLGYRLPIAHVDRIIKENGAEFGDEAHIIYVDSSKHEDTELGRLISHRSGSDLKKSYVPLGQQIIGGSISPRSEQVQQHRLMGRRLPARNQNTIGKIPFIHR